MTLALLFWILMLLWLVFGYLGWPGSPQSTPAPWWTPVGTTLILFLLLFLLGWASFGSPIK
jgi:hypothetical protein